MEQSRIAEGLEKVIALGEEMLATFDIESLLTRVVGYAQELLDTEGATLFLIDPGESLLISHVIMSDRIEEIVLPIDESSVAGFAALHQRILNIPDAYGDLTALHPNLKFNHEIDQTYGTRTRSILCAPVTHKGEAIGVFQVVNSRRGQFESDDERLLRSFAVMVGIAIRNVRQLETICDEREKSRDIIEHSSDFVVVLDNKGKILDLNLRARELVSPETGASVTGRSFTEVFPSFGNLRVEIEKLIDQSLDKVVSGGKVPHLLLASKNARNLVEKVYVILRRSEPAPGTPREDRVTDG